MKAMVCVRCKTILTLHMSVCISIDKKSNTTIISNENVYQYIKNPYQITIVWDNIDTKTLTIVISSWSLNIYKVTNLKAFA